MKKADLIAKAGSTAKLARLLNISTQAISKWGDGVPALRVYQLREKCPDWFAPPDDEKRDDAEELRH